jgi:hypothetical protein
VAAAIACLVATSRAAIWSAMPRKARGVRTTVGFQQCPGQGHDDVGFGGSCVGGLVWVLERAH